MVFEGDLLKGYTIDSVNNKVVRIDLPNVEERKMGKWIYDKDSQNWRCSECNETPKTLGYVGTADFMEKEFAFCNHCGAKMDGKIMHNHSCYYCKNLGQENVGEGLNPVCNVWNKDILKSKPTISAPNKCKYFEE